MLCGFSFLSSYIGGALKGVMGKVGRTKASNFLCGQFESVHFPKMKKFLFGLSPRVCLSLSVTFSGVVLVITANRGLGV